MSVRLGEGQSQQEQVSLVREPRGHWRMGRQKLLHTQQGKSSQACDPQGWLSCWCQGGYLRFSLLQIKQCVCVDNTVGKDVILGDKDHVMVPFCHDMSP